MYCSRCGNEINDGSRFCNKCGLATVQKGQGNGFERNVLVIGSDKKSKKKYVVVILCIVIFVGLVGGILFRKSLDSKSVEGKVLETVVQDEPGMLVDNVITSQDNENYIEYEAAVEADVLKENSDKIEEKRITSGDYINGWVEKRHVEADIEIGGYDYDYYILVCEVPYVLEVETENGSYEDRFVEILPNCAGGMEQYDRCFIECRVDNAWENLAHGPVTGERGIHVVVDVSDVKVWMSPAVMD